MRINLVTNTSVKEWIFITIIIFFSSFLYAYSTSHLTSEVLSLMLNKSLAEFISPLYLFLTTLFIFLVWPLLVILTHLMSSTLGYYGSIRHLAYNWGLFFVVFGIAGLINFYETFSYSSEISVLIVNSQGNNIDKIFDDFGIGYLRYMNICVQVLYLFWGIIISKKNYRFSWFQAFLAVCLPLLLIYICVILVN